MSIVNVNIKNCNCSSGSGSGSGTSSGNDVFDGDLGQSTDTPPRGYSQSAVSDRACKTAVWIYDWVHNWLDFMAGSAWVVTGIISLVAYNTVGLIIVRPLARIIGAAIGAVAALIGTPGLTPDDPVTIAISATVAEGMVATAVEYGANELTQAAVETSVSTFEDNRDAFICAIASGGNPNAAASNLETLLAAEFPSPIQWLIFNLSQVFLNLAYFSANWWPGFEDEIAGITETCCGGLVNGNPITPGSAQACTGANFVLDNLVATLTTADAYVQNYSRTVYNGVTASEAIMLSNVQSAFVVPTNISSKAWSWQLCQAELARYMWAKLGGDSWLNPGPGVNTWEMGRLGADLQVNIPICELRDAETPQAAYELLAAQIDAWLTAEVTDQDIANHVRLFCQGLIHPAGAFVGVMFAESADLAGFAGSSDCTECNPFSNVYVANGTCPELPSEVNRMFPVDGEWRTLYAENLGYWGLSVYDNFVDNVTPVARWNVMLEFRNMVGGTVSHPVHGYSVGSDGAHNNDIYAGTNFTSFQASLSACVGQVSFAFGSSYSVEMRALECSQ